MGLRQRFADAFRGVHHAERILDRNVLRAAGLHIQFGAAERRQDQRVFAGHQVAAVKLGADMHRQIAVAQGAGGALGVRRRGGQVAAQRDQHFHFAAQHRFDRFHRVVAQRAVGGKVKVALQAVEQRFGRLLVDPHGAVTLDVAVAAYRAQAGARFAQLPEQQLQVGDFAHRSNGVFMLRHAHRPGADHPFGALIGGRRLAQLRLAKARLRGNGLPLGGVYLRQVSFYANAVPFDKRQVEQGGLAGGQTLAVGFQQGFHHAAHRRHITAQIRLVIGRADRRGFWRQHLYRILRIGEPFQPTFAQGIEADDARAASGGVFQAVQHARVVGAGVLTEHEDGIGLFEVIDADGAFADADALFQPNAARLVAHIGTVGEIAGAEHAAEQLIKVRRFVAGAARSIQLDLVRVVHAVDVLGDQRQRIRPMDRLIVVSFGVVAHRMGEAPLILEEIVALLLQAADAVGGEELWLDGAARRFPTDRFGAVFAEAEGAVVVVAPGATGAVEAACLVDAHQVAHVF